MDPNAKLAAATGFYALRQETRDQTGQQITTAGGANEGLAQVEMYAAHPERQLL